MAERVAGVMAEVPEPRKARMLYFGCSVGHIGHFLFSFTEKPYRSRPNHGLKNFPFNIEELDTGFCPKGDAPGHGSFRHVKGWTVLAIWDRSEDDRGGSHSTYLVEGEISLDEITSLAKHNFQGEWERMIRKTPNLDIKQEGSQ